VNRRGRPLATLTPDWARLGADRPMTILPQARTEALLAEALATLGVAVERGLGVATIEQDAVGVAATLTDGGTARTPVLFAADGARSTVRKALGLDFPGDAWPEPWRLMDVDLEGPPTDEGWVDLRPDGPLICLPFSGHTFRLITFGADPLSALSPDWRVGEVRWSSEFRVSHRVAERLNVGRICLGGDAAHIHSPMGARGMNLGIEDAFVFAACAADFLKGDPARLDDYGRLRHAVDAKVVNGVRSVTSMIRASSPAADLARRLLLPVAARLPFVIDRALRVGMGLDHPVRVR
jgi:2-polyprenyl-6-methoxyphenol hydroxylase-like FAD-dependent oxidoreductase